MLQHDICISHYAIAYTAPIGVLYIVQLQIRVVLMCMCMCMCMRMCICMCMRMYKWVSIHVYLCMYMCICMYVYIYFYAYMYMHTFLCSSPTAECSLSLARAQDLQCLGVCMWCDAVHNQPDNDVEESRRSNKYNITLHCTLLHCSA